MCRKAQHCTSITQYGLWSRHFSAAILMLASITTLRLPKSCLNFRFSTTAAAAAAKTTTTTTTTTTTITTTTTTTTTTLQSGRLSKQFQKWIYVRTYGHIYIYIYIYDITTSILKLHRAVTLWTAHTLKALKDSI
jgi:hypothetical protein